MTQIQTHDIPTELIPLQSQLEIARTSPDNRDFIGRITLGPESLSQILTAYVANGRESIQLAVAGQKTPGCPRFIGDISFIGK